MPYMFVEEVPEGHEVADVYERADYDAVVAERDSAIEQRDTALGQIGSLEARLRESQAKYADAFLTSPARMKQQQRKDVMDDGKVRSFEELFSMKGDEGAY